jgi:hypothetical protein
MTTNNKGFSHVETFIVLLVIIVIGAIGFSVYKRSSDNKFKLANAAGCPVASRMVGARAEHWRVNREVWVRDQGSSYLWVLKIGGSSERPKDINNSMNRMLKDHDLRLLQRAEMSSMFGFGGTAGGATWDEICKSEQRCGDPQTSNWGDDARVRGCRTAELNKSLPKYMSGMKTIYNDKKGVKLKACRDSKNPAKPVRFAVYDIYTKARQVAASRAGGTPTDSQIASAQGELYNYSSPDGNLPSVANENFVGYLELNSGKTRLVWSGRSKIASIQRIRSNQGVSWYTGQRQPKGQKETLYFYNKIEGYDKKANGGETNPKVKFRIKYRSNGQLVSKTVTLRFKTLSTCGKNMFPATYFEEAVKSGWERPESPIKTGPYGDTPNPYLDRASSSTENYTTSSTSGSSSSSNVFGGSTNTGRGYGGR